MTPLEAMRNALDALGAIYQYYREAEALYDHNWQDSRSIDYHNAIVNLRTAIEEIEKTDTVIERLEKELVMSQAREISWPMP